MTRDWPPWLTRSARGAGVPCPCGLRGFRLGRLVSGRTLRNVSTYLERLVAGGHYAGRDGYLQRLDARARLLVLVALLVTMTFLRSHASLAAGYALALALAVASGIPLTRFCGDVWRTVSLFSGLVALPALFSPVTPGEPLWVLSRSGEDVRFLFLAIPAEVAITRTGVMSVSLLVLRVVTCVSFAALLTTTSRHEELLGALSSLGVRSLPLLTVQMTLRFLTLLLRTVQSMYEARESRRARPLRPVDERHFAASRAAALFHGALVLNEEIHAAMVSRGFSGRFRALVPAYPRSARGKALLWPLAGGSAIAVLNASGLL